MNTLSSLLKWIGNTIGANPNTLETTDKTIVGAINEVKDGVYSKSEVYSKADYVYLSYEDFLNTTRTPQAFPSKGTVALTRELDAPEIQEYNLLSTPAFRVYDTNDNEVPSMMYFVRYAYSNASNKHMYVRVDFYNPSGNSVSVKKIVMNFIACPY